MQSLVVEDVSAVENERRLLHILEDELEKSQDGELPKEFAAGVDNHSMYELINRNDGLHRLKEHSFSEIADFIESGFKVEKET